jgi:phosphoglycolate phosphatase
MQSQKNGTILFDLDGTLTDNQAGIFRCIRYAMGRIGFPLEESVDLRWCVGPPLQDSLAKLAGNNPEMGFKALEIYRKEYGQTGMFENRVYDGIPESLAILQDSFHLYVATSKLEPYAQRIVEHFQMNAFFKKVYGCGADGTHSDKAELIQHLMRKEKPLTPVIMVGDREHDMIGARKNGIGAVGVTWGFGSEEELRKAGAKTILHHPRELTDAF